MNTHERHSHRNQVIWEKANLIIALNEWEYSSTPTKHTWNWNHQLSVSPISDTHSSQMKSHSQMNTRHFQPPSPSLHQNHEECSNNSRTSLEFECWRMDRVLQWLFMRAEWCEYFLWLWRHSCTGMLVEDTHRWDWACLNIIHSTWESLSRVMWRGKWNE